MNLKLIRFIAKRFSQSNKRQRFLNFARTVALVSVMLGSMSLIISLAVLEGFETMLRENAVKFTSHITIGAHNHQPLPEYPLTISRIKSSVPGVSQIAPKIEREGLIRSKIFVEGILIRGIKPEYDITNMKKNIVSGKYAFTSDTSKEIIIGRRLADRLGVDTGGSVVVYAIKSEDEEEFAYPEIDKFRVSAIYETGMAKYDDIVVLIPFETAADLFKYPANSVTSYDVMVKDLEQINLTAKQVEETLGFPYYVLTVFQLHAAIFAWIELQKAPIPIVLGLISIVAVLNIITILLVIVVEKTHSIGILRAIGMSNGGIMSIFIAQGVVIGLAGTLTGCGLGFILSWLQQTFGIVRLQGQIYYLDTLPIHISVWHYAIVIGISIILSFMATLVPSFIAVNVKPISAIRFK